MLFPDPRGPDHLITRSRPRTRRSAGTCAALGGWFPRHRRSGCGSLLRLDVKWEENGEGGSDVGGAIDRDRAVVGLDDSVAHAEPQTRSLSRRFGGEERLEHTLCDGWLHAMTGIRHDDLYHPLLALRQDRQMANLRSLHCRLGVDEQVEEHLLQFLLVASHLRVRFVEVHVYLDAARARSERTQSHRVLHDGVDVDDDVARLGLASEKEQISNHADRPIRLALDQAHRLELLALQSVLEQQLGESRNSRERIVQLVGDAGNQLANCSKLFGASKMVGDFLLLGEIADADDETDDVVAPIANVAERDRCRELRAVFSAVHMLAGPEGFVELDGGNCLTP